MKNLTLHQHQWKSLDVIKNYKFLSVDSDSSGSYLLTEDKLFYVNKDDANPPLLIWQSTSKLDVVHVEFLSIAQKLSIADRSGTLLELNIEGTPAVEEVGECISGLVSAAWSPDQELLVLVTAQLSVILMTSDYFPLTEYHLTNTEFGEKSFINVGWGKKETQFHGSEGKQAAKAKEIVAPIQDPDNVLPAISWRGDSALFCVGFPSATGRNFKVFNREGVLQYTSENVGGLGGALAWRPSGNLIATPQVLPNKYVIAFFEKNGLQHGSFDLPFKFEEIRVEGLSWSNDSEILCVQTKNIVTEEKCLLLYTIGNYHWYLKQSLRFSKGSGPMDIFWDSSIGKGKTIHILTENGKLMYYRWENTINHSSGVDEDDGSCVSVIDGNKILFTNFRGVCVPPPMASFTVQFDSFVNHIVYAPSNLSKQDDYETKINSNMFMAVLDDNSIILCKPEFDGMKVSDIKTSAPVKIEFGLEQAKAIESSGPLFWNHWCWINENTVVCMNTASNSSKVLVIDLKYTNENYELKASKEIGVDDVIVSIERSSNNSAILQAANGFLLSLNFDNVKPEPLFSLPQTCIMFKSLTIEGEEFTFGMTERNRFYVNAVEVANNVTSFYLHSDFLLMTTLQHTLLTIKLSKANMEYLTKNKSMSNDHMPDFVMCRKLERGSKLIVAVPKDTRTVMQLPRGNLETIQPRSLSLHLIKKFLNDKNYKAAFELFRRQRINLNLIVDHDPTLFLENIRKFIDDISNPMWISLFVSELNNEDVTKSMYSSSYTREEQVSLQNKINVVCSLLRNELETHDEADSFIYPILATYVKKHTVKDLESALLKVKELKQSPDKNLPISADDALKYLLYLIDVNELYDVALGLYDFDLVMYIARKSQKDPKEYMPFLNVLNKMEEHYRYYTIDKHLKRYESALKHISKCEDKFNECMTFISNHGLYKIALRLFEPDNENYTKVAFLYGEHLNKMRHQADAALMFKRSGNLEKALECFMAAQEWRECLILAKDLNYSPQDVIVLCRKLAEILKESRRFSESGEIYLYHVNDIESAVEVYLQGKHWADVQKCCKLHNRIDLLETHVKPGLIECMTNLTQQITTISESFNQYSKRLFLLNELREQAVNQHSSDILLEDDEKRVTNCDLYSDTSSVAGSTVTRSSYRSGLSGRSFRSSKNRRKHEKKLLSLKEGSPFERPALITALHGLVLLAFSLRTDVGSTCRAALDFDWDERASELQKHLSTTLKDMEGNFNKIWTHDLFVYKEPSTDLTTNELMAHMNDKNSDLGPEYLEQHLRMKPQITNISWECELLK